MDELVSICIPTCQRPELLRKTIASCLQQSYGPFEILISDDSHDDSTERMVQNLNTFKPITYRRNTPPCGQARNVNQLFDLAKGERLVLIHDDDRLLPNALKDLSHAWTVAPKLTACYGKQYIIDIDDQILASETAQHNESYCRTSEREGQQPSELWAALVGQFPNNGFMILTKAAQTVRYKGEEEVGAACDYDFGLRIAQAHKGFYFVDTFVSDYRLTPGAIRTTKSTADFTYNLIKALPVPSSLNPTRTKRLRQYASPAVSRYLRLGDRKKALSIFLSQDYPFWHKISLKGLMHALLILCPDKLRQHLMNIKGARFWL